MRRSSCPPTTPRTSRSCISPSSTSFAISSRTGSRDDRSRREARVRNGWGQGYRTRDGGHAVARRREGRGRLSIAEAPRRCARRRRGARRPRHDDGSEESGRRGAACAGRRAGHPRRQPRRLAAGRRARCQAERRAVGNHAPGESRRRDLRVPRGHPEHRERWDDRARRLDSRPARRGVPRRLRRYEARRHLVYQVSGRRIGAQDHGELRCAGVGRYRYVGRRAQGQARDPRHDPPRPRRTRRGYRGSDRISVLESGAAHHGRDSEREWGLGALRMTFPSQLAIPPEVLKIAKKLEDAGFETWCVGGAIRDNLLGLENQDFDLTTSAPPAEVQKVFKRTVPVGIEHGTVAVLDATNQPHEVTTFRKDIQTDGRHAVVEFGVSLMDDLARRDFTINAIAYHPITHEWRDPFQGAQDLEKKLIRSVGDPNWRFQEDYLRILRALRFSARFEFRIHARTLEAAKANSQGLAQLSAERVRDEWFKGIQTAKKVSKLVTLWRDVGATRIWLPELGDSSGVDKLPRDPVLVTAYIAKDPASLLIRLKSSNRDIERGRAIGKWRDSYPDPRDAARVRKWLAETGDYVDELLVGASDALRKTVAAVRTANPPLGLKDLAVKGDDLIAAGVRPGPDVGEALARLLEEVLEDPSRNTKEYLLSRV